MELLTLALSAVLEFRQPGTPTVIPLLLHLQPLTLTALYLTRKLWVHPNYWMPLMCTNFPSCLFASTHILGRMTALRIKGKLNYIEKNFWYFLTLAIKIRKRTPTKDLILKGCLLYAFQFFVPSKSLLAGFLWTVSSCSTSGTELLILNKLSLVWSYLRKINSGSYSPPFSLPSPFLFLLFLAHPVNSSLDIMFWRVVIQVSGLRNNGNDKKLLWEPKAYFSSYSDAF